MTYEEIRKNPEVNAFMERGNANLGVLGYTDHSKAHTGFVAERAAWLLRELGYSEKEIELAKIAGYMHDIGNAVNRKQHAEYGAILANSILEKTDMSLEDRVTVVSDTVNYAVTKTEILLNDEKDVITLNLEIDESICSMYEYFDIFLTRMMMSRRAAEMLGAKFKLRVNGEKVL